MSPKLSRIHLCGFVLALYAAVALWAEVTHFIGSHHDESPAYNRVNLAARNLPPLSPKDPNSSAPSHSVYLLGTDSLGRDVALRLAQGTRIAFHVGIVTSAIAIPLGALLGLLAGYFRKATDAILCALAAMIASIPSMLFILAIAMVIGKGLLGVYLGIGLTTWVGVFRTVRAETMKHRNAGYVQAARVLGYGPCRILFRHIFPNVAHIVIIAFATRFPAAVGTEVFMSFLGIGAQNEPSWGIMINNARARLWTGQWWEGLSVTLAIFGLVLCFNLLGDALRDALDPTLRKSHV